MTALSLRQYVTFGIGDALMAVPVHNVREVLDVDRPTAMPNAPSWLLGIIDLRGTSVPVIDLRVKLGLPAAAVTAQSRVIVLEVDLYPPGRQPLIIGALADRVCEVTALDEHAIEGPPDLGARWPSQAIAGIGRRGARFVILLALAEILSSADILTAGGGHD